MQRRAPIVAIDGPSGAGKSTVARTVAQARGLRYLDTGAMYRAVTWLALQRHTALDDAAALAALATGAVIDVTTDPERPRISIDGVDVTQAVRSPAVTAAVSAVSAVTAIRAEMVARQRKVIGEGGIVVEGRDIGTTVVPDATVKVFLTADAATRADRRMRQDGDPAETVHATAADLARRDRADSTRKNSPLRQAPDATVLDSSQLDVATVVSQILERFDRVVAGRSH